MQNKRKLAELIEDDYERADLAAELTALRAQQRGMATEREAALIHTRRAEAQTQALERVQDWAARLGPRVDDLSMRERQQVLAALGARVQVWRVGDRDPRVALDLHLPVSGVLPVVDEPDGGKGVFVMTVTGKVQKYLLRQQAIEELGLEAAAGVQTA